MSRSADLPVAPTLTDVVDRLLDPSSGMATTLHTTPAALAVGVRQAALELRRLLAGDLAGMVDGPSTSQLDPDGRGDRDRSVGGLRHRRPRQRDGVRRRLAVAGDRPGRRPDAGCCLSTRPGRYSAPPRRPRWLQGVSKLARRHGVALITVVHRCSDLSGQADAGTATQAQARGLLADAETRVVYGQPPGERAAVAELLDLSDTETELVDTPSRAPRAVASRWARRRGRPRPDRGRSGRAGRHRRPDAVMNRRACCLGRGRSRGSGHRHHRRARRVAARRRILGPPPTAVAVSSHRSTVRRSSASQASSRSPSATTARHDPRRLRSIRN